MKPAIVSLPITPRATPKMGLMLVPYIMDVISKKMSIDRILALNVNGLKLETGNIETCVDGYLAANSDFGIEPHLVWRDDQQESIHWIGAFFRQFVAEGFITKERRNLFRCPCGIVETLVSAENFSDARRLYDKIENKRCCKICRGAVSEEIGEVYLFKIPSLPVTTWSVTPAFTCKEIIDMAVRFAGSQLLISRTRDSAISLWTGEEHIFLDADFGWQLYLPILRRSGYQPVALVGSQRNLFGGYLAMVLSFLVDKVTPELIVPAYCKVARNIDASTLSSFPKWNRSVARLFLASHCTFQRKEIVFDLSLKKLAYYVVHRMGEVVATGAPLSLADALARCEGMKLRQTLLQKRANRAVDEEIFSGIFQKGGIDESA